MTYTFIPYQRPAWRDVIPGMVTAAILIELGKLALVYYMDNLSKFDELF